MTDTEPIRMRKRIRDEKNELHGLRTDSIKILSQCNNRIY